LKQLSTERKQTISELQQQLEEARQQLATHEEDPTCKQDLRLIQESAAAKVKEAEESAAVKVKEAEERAATKVKEAEVAAQILRADLEAERRQIEELEAVKASAPGAAASPSELLLITQQLEDERQQRARFQVDYEQCLSRLSDVTEQRDALKEAVQDMQASAEENDGTRML
jgi:chromosome segregation ATPase